jgi:hypothetical protein
VLPVDKLEPDERFARGGEQAVASTHDLDDRWRDPAADPELRLARVGLVIGDADFDLEAHDLLNGVGGEALLGPSTCASRISLR